MTEAQAHVDAITKSDLASQLHSDGLLSRTFLAVIVVQIVAVVFVFFGKLTGPEWLNAQPWLLGILAAKSVGDGITVATGLRGMGQ